MESSQVIQGRVIGPVELEQVRSLLATHPASHSVTISAKPPHVLSVVHVEEAPVILFQENGVLNKLTPEDMIEVQKRLEDGARNDDAVQSGLDMAINQLKEYFAGLFQMQNYTVTFDFGAGITKG